MMVVPIPPLPFPPGFFQGLDDVCGVGEICSRDDYQLEGIAGMGQLGPISAITGGIVGGAASIFSTIEQKKESDEQAALEAQALKLQKQEDARNFALTQAQIAQQPAQEKQTTTMLALYAIGGIAAIVSGIFLVAAIRSKKDTGS
jgi:uncharacterized membrane protein YuzA (DUF378 family)